MSAPLTPSVPRPRRLRFGTAAFAGLVVSALVAGVAAPAFADTSPSPSASASASASALKPVTRLSGNDRIGTAIHRMLDEDPENCVV